ncbi:MAG: carbon-nitrogen hydrolase family protein [Myxococcota bacterium]
MRVAVVQMTSTDDLPANLDAAEAFVAEAAERGAQWVALPENFAYLRREGLAFPCAQGLDGEIVGRLRSWARRHGVWLLGGTFPESIRGESRVHNTCPLLSPEGELAAVYRKIHLFDVDLGAGGGGRFQESAHFAPGDEIVVAETPFGGIGLSVCYDLRFPELYREMAVRGARFVTVPSAFAPHTGKDHWEVLLRARAVENQVFVLAPAQCGQHSPDRASYGRSMIVDPWGLVLARAADRPGVVTADCDPGDLERIRAAVPCLAHRRL